MERRDFLRLCGSGLGGLVLGSRLALGQENDTTTTISENTAPTAPGVTPNEIKIGMSAAFRGSAVGLGTEYLRGSLACYDEINAQGGVYGRRVNVVAYNDDHEPVPAITNTVQLVESDQVFFLSNYVGTSTLTRVLPVIKRYDDEQLLLVGNLTGAQPQREPPYADQVFNIRASYRQEMMAMVDRLWAAGLRRLGVFYQIDAYGRSGTDGVARGLATHGAKIVAEATYRRSASFTDDMKAAVEHLRKAAVEAVLCTGAYQGCGAFVRAAREAGWEVPITNVSFVGCEAMLRLLQEHGQAAGRDMTARLINSQVVPNYDDTTLPGVVAYRAAMDRFDPQVPADLHDSAYTVERYSFISLEGYINGRVIVEALQRAGENPTRAGLKAALESFENLDLGIGAPINFGPGRHQGLDEVYFTHIEGGRWVPIADWNAALRS